MGRTRLLLSLTVALCATTSLFGVAPAGASSIFWTNGSALSDGSIGTSSIDGSDARPDFITGASYPNGITAVGDHIYWANGGTGSIARANLDGSDVNLQFVPGVSASDVAVDGSHVYWVAGSRIGRANLDGSKADSNFLPTLGGTSAVAVDSGHIYWVNNIQRQENVSGVPSIGRADLNGSRVDQGFIPLTYTSAALGGLAVNNTNVYWSDANSTGSGISRADIDGSNVRLGIIGGADRPCGLALDATSVYWNAIGHFNGSGFSGNAIGKANLDGSGVNQAIARTSAPGCGMASEEPLPPPSNNFTLSKGRRDQRLGTVVLKLNVVGQGAATVGGPGVRSQRRASAAGGALLLKVRPNHATALRLRQRQRASVRVLVKYKPTGGKARGKRRTVMLKRQS